MTQLPVIVGEWSLALDNCAMWLNGFNDNLPGFPQTTCQYIDCIDSSVGLQGPFSTTGQSGPIFGKCPIDGAAHTDAMKTLGEAKSYVFDHGAGWFFWNFKVELESRWSFIEASKLGWIPAKMTIGDISHACDPFLVDQPSIQSMWHSSPPFVMVIVVLSSLFVFPALVALKLLANGKL